MPGTVILPEWLIEDAKNSPRKNWGVRVQADRISDVAPNQVLRERYPDDHLWEAPTQCLAPGFVNTHTHLYGVLAHGIPLRHPPSGFFQFLAEFWWPVVENRLDQEMICSATDLQCARLLLSGVTSFYDCLEAPFALPGCLDAQAEVVRRRGLRGIMSFEATERVSRENGQSGLSENVEFVESCRKNRDLVSGIMCLHTSFTCSDAFIRQAFEIAREANTLIHMHCSEGSYEPEYTQQHYGKRPMHYYDGLGALGPNVLASQCVQIDASEIALMSERGVRMSHMPLSNCEVGGGIAPVPELVEAGVPVGLGSDGYIDDFFEVMRGAFLIHKASHHDPAVMPAKLVWHLATEGGARALGFESVGSLKPGWQADLQLIDANLPTPVTEDNLYEQMLLYRNQTDVRGVMVAGRTRVRQGELVETDLAELRNRVHRSAARLWTGS